MTTVYFSINISFGRTPYTSSGKNVVFWNCEIYFSFTWFYTRARVCVCVCACVLMYVWNETALQYAQSIKQIACWFSCMFWPAAKLKTIKRIVKRRDRWFIIYVYCFCVSECLCRTIKWNWNDQHPLSRNVLCSSNLLFTSQYNICRTFSSDIKYRSKCS